VLARVQNIGIAMGATHARGKNIKGCLKSEKKESEVKITDEEGF
jgi:hypothetical protein